MLRPILFLAALAACHLARPAYAETVNCTNITSVPAVITTQGIYCLKQDLQTSITSGAAITIATNNVTLDCNDWKIGGLAAGPGTHAIGIAATARLNLTIRHCGVRGFEYGIKLDDEGAGHLVEDNRADFNTFAGIEVDGDSNVVRRNRIVDTGGPGYGTNALVIRGRSALVADNIVAGVITLFANSPVIGVNVFGGDHEFRENLVTRLVKNGSGSVIGIYGSGFATYRGNTISGASTSEYGLYGNSSVAVCKDNIVNGFIQKITFCTDGGGNVAN